MQVSRRAADGDLREGEPAQEGGNGGGVGVPLPGIADKRDVGPELVAMGGQKRGKTGTPGLFLALDEHADIDGKLSVLCKPGTGRLDKGHQLAFVVGGAAGDDNSAVAWILDQTRIERWRAPFIQRLGRLHVVMTVEEH